MNSFVVVYFVWITLLKESIGRIRVELRNESNFNNENGGYRRILLLGRNQILLNGDIRKQMASVTLLDQVIQNVVCSPLGAIFPLIQLLNGAIDDLTMVEELLKATGTTPNEINKDFRRMSDLFRSLIGPSGIYTKFFKVNTITAVPIITRRNDKAFFEEVSFMNDKPSAVKTINNWAKGKTNNIIRGLVRRSDILDSNSNGILASIGFFNSHWKNRFRPGRRASFYSPGGRKVQPTMRIKNEFMYLMQKDINVQLLQVPFSNGANFLLVLPNKKDGLGGVLTTFKDQPQLLNDMYGRMSLKFIDLSMPKFKIEAEFDLETILKDLGVQSIFYTGVNLRGFNINSSLIVSKAIQKCVIDISEDGAKDFSNFNLTGFANRRVQTPKIKVNHPFLFYVIYQNEQLFAGIYNGDINDEFKLHPSDEDVH